MELHRRAQEQTVIIRSMLSDYLQRGDEQTFLSGGRKPAGCVNVNRKNRRAYAHRSGDDSGDGGIRNRVVNSDTVLARLRKW